MPRIIRDMSTRFNNTAKAQKKTPAAKAVDTLKAVQEVVGNNAADIEVGQGVALNIPATKTPKAFLAIVRGRLVSATRLGEPLAGRYYKTMLDNTGEKPAVLIMRAEDGAPLGRKVGGRPKGSGNKNNSNASPSLQSLVEGENKGSKETETPTPNAATNNNETQPEINKTTVRDLTAKNKKADNKPENKAA